MGGGTSKIGDPSGKDTARGGLLTDEQIETNIASIRTVFSRFLDFHGGAIMDNNANWLDGLRYIPLLRDVGRHFTINKMLTFDSVKLRLDRAARRVAGQGDQRGEEDARNRNDCDVAWPRGRRTGGRDGAYYF